MTVAVKDVLYTAEVVDEGGRDGHARGSDGRLEGELDTPSELEGGGGPGTNPEQLFAAAFSACFQSALEGIARGRNLDVSGSTITARVGVGPVADGLVKLERVNARLEIDLAGELVQLLDLDSAQGLVGSRTVAHLEAVDEQE